ncbi:uncharacterized protein BP5553_00680 [Venustampulla echinocandica]|uniref:Uncharacterized protein n=1 Tax=Venustampulla echinocandica TaxID=2656787 RepID=A0A370TYW1_9HELO|nr:uncharacterized protein BP5553_00680 [Venustampulla echinocandica]RDL40701.1 hypothetical protein BP5553_00680 [Venustampulla echinocandica]
MSTSESAPPQHGRRLCHNINVGLLHTATASGAGMPRNTGAAVPKEKRSVLSFLGRALLRMSFVESGFSSVLQHLGCRRDVWVRGRASLEWLCGRRPMAFQKSPEIASSTFRQNQRQRMSNSGRPFSSPDFLLTQTSRKDGGIPILTPQARRVSCLFSSSQGRPERLLDAGSRTSPASPAPASLHETDTAKRKKGKKGKGCRISRARSYPLEPESGEAPKLFMQEGPVLVAKNGQEIQCCPVQHLEVEQTATPGRCRAMQMPARSVTGPRSEYDQR